MSLEAAATRGEALDHVLLAGPAGSRQDVAGSDRRRRTGRAVRADSWAGARAQRRHRRLSDRARAPGGVLRRRDPPAPTRARGDLLPRDGGPLPADHGRTGSRRTRRDARAAAVHAGRRHDENRAVDDSAARPLRDPAPIGALFPDDLARIVRRSARLLEIEIDDARRSRDRITEPWNAACRKPALEARADYAEVRDERCGDRGGRCCPRPARGRRGRVSTGSTARFSERSARSFGGGPSDSRRWRSRSGRSPTRSRTCTSRISPARPDRANARGGGRRPGGPSSISASNRRVQLAALRGGGRALDAPPDPVAILRRRHVQASTTSSARTAETGRWRPTAPPISGREVRGCEKCGFAYLFELLDDTTRLPTPPFSPATGGADPRLRPAAHSS